MIPQREKFRSYLGGKNLKFTPERQLILKEIFSFNDHFDVDSLYVRVHKKDKRLSRATIYRVLPLLVDCGLVRETLRCQDKINYEHSFGHYHMFCVDCGRVVEFREEGIKELVNLHCKKHGFNPLKHNLGIRGYCRNCR